jgi:OFA family oxalate/formate antiporter-like MFS transporter
MIARTITGRWFRKNLGMVSGTMGIVISFAFGAAPLLLITLIHELGWYWGMLSLVLLALSAGILGCIIFRDSPPELRTADDGNSKEPSKLTSRDYSLTEAKQSLDFWLFNMALTLQAAIITAYTFHFTGIASDLGMVPKSAFKIFIPMAIVGTTTNLLGGYFSDRSPLRSLLLILLVAQCLTTFAVQYMDQDWGYYGIALGFGISGGLHSCLTVVAWPKLFGTRELGAITGYSLGWAVFGSAIGPYLVSLIPESSANLSKAFSYLTLGPCIVFLICFIKPKPSPS